MRDYLRELRYNVHGGAEVLGGNRTGRLLEGKRWVKEGEACDREKRGSEILKQ